MKNNLSSQITLNRIPQKYYRPENAFEQSALTRFENLPVDIYETSTEGSVVIAKEIAAQIKQKQEIGAFFVMAVSGGNSPREIFKELVRLHKEEKLSFSNVIVFNIYEYYPLQCAANSSTQTIKECFVSQVDIAPENFYSPDGTMAKEQVLDFCQMYEQRIQNVGGIDYMLLGVGHAGNIGFNAAGSPINSSTRLVLMDEGMKKEVAKTFNTIESVPYSAITMGISTILKAKHIVLTAWGEDKARVIKETVEGKVNANLPASYLQNHLSVKVVLDLSASLDLTRISNPWLVTSCEWDSKLIRRAIVWLCLVTDKPILKLTNKDYSQHGLGELLALYGSAYNVNIRVFNELQHTITGWPGGKPNADDTNRPERANPFPKRVIVFSPHPDDDVISMGGTFKRLVDQKHDVYVAYETSGNIAVGDEEVVRYVSLMKHVCEKYSPKDTAMITKCDEIKNYLLNEKKEGDMDTADILFMKGRIRREEATTACRYIGVPESHINFLDLPFYETGKVKKGDLSQADVDIVKALLQEVKPQQMFVAGDLADPHGTHKVCLDAVLAAIDDLKTEEWMKECRIWMYRGAWAEWEIDHIEMAVPISPEELRQKRNSILKHQSQMESAPFLGNDERLFWQRAEDRNRATAELYNKLGLASYEAIEAFVEYLPL